ncbi:MAG: AAA family ATPase [Acidiphilium sp.]
MMDTRSPEEILRDAGGSWQYFTDDPGPADNSGQEKNQGPALWIDDDDWTEADIPRRPWVAPGYALRGAVTLVAGPPSVMKSSLMLAWATSLALGQPFGRFRPVQALNSVVYNVEDDAVEQRRRLSAVLRQFGALPCAICGHVIRTGPEKVGTLIVRTEDGIVASTPALAKLTDLVRQTGAAMLVVDPLAELHTVEENDNTGLRSVIAEFRRLAVAENIAVIVLHHTRKGASASAGDPESARGASSIIGAVRVALTLTGMTEDDAKAFGLPTDHKNRSAYIRLDDAKSNYSAIGEAQWFEKTVYDLDNGERVPAPVPWNPPAAKVASLDDLAALAAAIERGSPCGEPWSPSLSKEQRSVRSLLEQHGFAGLEAQKGALAGLEHECGMLRMKFRTKATRNKVNGLRIGDKPRADWLDEEG